MLQLLIAAVLRDYGDLKQAREISDRAMTIFSLANFILILPLFNVTSLDVWRQVTITKIRERLNVLVARKSA